jgi:hypothetical protein
MGSYPHLATLLQLNLDSSHDATTPESSATRKLSRNGVVGSKERGSGRMVGQPQVIRFIRQAARRRRFFRCCLAVSNFRPRSVRTSC